MNLRHIQSEIFRELVSIETLLKPEWRFHVVKHPIGYIDAALLSRKDRSLVDKWQFTPHTITKPDQITAEINRIWDAIPAECKRDDILK